MPWLAAQLAGEAAEHHVGPLIGAGFEDMHGRCEVVIGDRFAGGPVVPDVEGVEALLAGVEAFG
jgi:hypothetical protein